MTLRGMAFVQKGFLGGMADGIKDMISLQQKNQQLMQQQAGLDLAARGQNMRFDPDTGELVPIPEDELDPEERLRRMGFEKVLNDFRRTFNSSGGTSSAPVVGGEAVGVSAPQISGF